jgi:hypothetical protein
MEMVHLGLTLFQGIPPNATITAEHRHGGEAYYRRTSYSRRIGSPTRHHWQAGLADCLLRGLAIQCSAMKEMCSATIVCPEQM